MTHIPAPPPSKPQQYDPVAFIDEVVDPALFEIQTISCCDTMSTPEAKQYMLAISLQESDLRYRKQTPSGPARGFWQFEGGENQALDLLIKHDTVGPWLEAYSISQVLPCKLSDLYSAVQYHDQLAAVLARLLLYTDYRKLTMDEYTGWQIYLACWQPGHPRPEDWPDSWARAKSVLDEFYAV